MPIAPRSLSQLARRTVRSAQADATQLLLHTEGWEVRTLLPVAKRAEAQVKVAETRSQEQTRGRQRSRRD